MWKTMKGKADVSRSGRGEQKSLRKDDEGREVERKRLTAADEEKQEAAEIQEENTRNAKNRHKPLKHSALVWEDLQRKV